MIFSSVSRLAKSPYVCKYFSYARNYLYKRTTEQGNKRFIAHDSFMNDVIFALTKDIISPIIISRACNLIDYFATIFGTY